MKMINSSRMHSMRWLAPISGSVSNKVTRSMTYLLLLVRKTHHPFGNRPYGLVPTSRWRSAYAEQQRQTLDAWCVYQARAALNDKSKGSDEGTELGKQLGDTSEAGVLGIVIRVDRPGAKPKVERAEMEGLNEGLRSLIENRRGACGRRRALRLRSRAAAIRWQCCLDCGARSRRRSACH